MTTLPSAMRHAKLATPTGPTKRAAGLRGVGGLRRASAVVLATYLLLTGPAVLFAWHRAGWDADGGMLLAAGMHAAALALFARWSRPGAYPDTRIAELLPLLVIPFLYAELPILMAGFGAEYRDPMIQRLEEIIFGGQPAQTFASLLPYRAVSELLHLAYVSYYPLVYVPAILLAWRGDGMRLRQIVFVLVLTFASFYVVFAVFPVQGPRYLWPAPPDAPGGVVRTMTLAILESGSSRGAAFPSVHMGAAVALALLILRWSRALGAATAAVALGLGLGAVYGGFHYAVDMIAGAALGALTFIAAMYLMKATSVRHARAEEP